MPNCGQKASAEPLSKEAEALMLSNHQLGDNNNAEREEAKAGAVAKTPVGMRESPAVASAATSTVAALELVTLEVVVAADAAAAKEAAVLLMNGCRRRSGIR